MRHDSAGVASGPQRPVLIHRHVTLSLAAFDRLKVWQRRLEQGEDRRLTNGEVLDALILAVPFQ
jgi:hypothetical protein